MRSDVLRGIEDRDQQAFRVFGPLSCDALRYDRSSHAPRETLSEVHHEVRIGERRPRTGLEATSLLA